MANYESQDPSGSDQAGYADDSYGQDQPYEQDGNEQYEEYEEDPDEHEQHGGEQEGWDENDPTQYSQQGDMQPQDDHMQQHHDPVQHQSAEHMQQSSHAVPQQHSNSHMPQHPTGHQQQHSQAQAPVPQTPANPSQSALAKEEKEVAAPGESQQLISTLLDTNTSLSNPFVFPAHQCPCRPQQKSLMKRVPPLGG
ncbi:hypothetical protein PV11_06164 [Exophiala sideris]|uniref:Uncharacterized protein n=1 Tax=Exophiala sideris TaxID=1016849 RepID=A0A0D1X8Q4_9EURO|nr:hypothetical protein PV11_06164 [Exophiala sideris]